MKPLELWCATGNRHKLAEFQRAAGHGIQIEACGSLECPETGDTFEANAVQKALCYAKAGPADRLVFADDSGIVVDALNGAPGIYSARFAGDEATDDANNRLLVEKLEGVPEEHRTGRFVCLIALVRGEETLATFAGTAEGRILEAEVGAGGFGYDPLFYFPPTGCAFAELSPERKWAHSHRGKAFRAMLDWLRRSGALAV